MDVNALVSVNDQISHMIEVLYIRLENQGSETGISNQESSKMEIHASVDVIYMATYRLIYAFINRWYYLNFSILI